MKYWRGYLVAAIIAACSWGLIEFAQSHWVLVDMVYPYVSRMIQTFLTDWSAAVDFCLWQLLLLVLIAGGLASIVMMVVWKWNPIQWFGWILSVVSIVFFMNTVIYGLNDYSGPLSADIRLEMTEYTASELEAAGEFYRDQANKLAQEISRDASGNPQFPAFQELTVQAGEGFRTQTYDHFQPIFAGSLVPVKELGWSDFFTSRGVTGITVPITGEAAVNPQTPAVGLPFAICRQMAERMCISNDQDAAFAAFLACDANSAPEFRYSAYFMAYRYCYEALASMDTSVAQAAAAKLAKGENTQLRSDLDAYNNSFAPAADKGYAPADTDVPEDAPIRSNVADLLTAWHIQEYVLPAMAEEVTLFDPLDETQVDLTTNIDYTSMEELEAEEEAEREAEETEETTEEE